MLLKPKFASFAIGCALMLAACGGGGSDTNVSPGTSPPIPLQVQSKSTTSAETVQLINTATGESQTYQCRSTPSQPPSPRVGTKAPRSQAI
jgi:ABC-type glycerol-3-phosphate transport system substrate-binding protein